MSSKTSDFRLEEFPVPQPGAGQMLLRTKWLSLDPYMRGRMSDAPSYAKPVGVGEVMEGGTVSEVIHTVSGLMPLYSRTPCRTRGYGGQESITTPSTSRAHSC